MSEKYQWLHLRSIDTTGSYLVFVIVKGCVRRRSTTNGYRPIYTVNYCVIPHFTHTKDSNSTNHPATPTTYILISHIYTVFFFFQERSQYMYAGFTPIQFNFTISFHRLYIYLDKAILKKNSLFSQINLPFRSQQPSSSSLEPNRTVPYSLPVPCLPTIPTSSLPTVLLLIHMPIWTHLPPYLYPLYTLFLPCLPQPGK